MAVKSTFTRIPKVNHLVQVGVPTEVIPTYAALADYSNNKTGLCWPRMETLARRLSRSPRTIQRHIHFLKELGLVELVERTRDRRGRFGAYIYRLVHIVAATVRQEAEKAGRRARERGKTHHHRTWESGHGSRLASNTRQTKQKEDPQTPNKDRTRGFWWSFGQEAPPGAEEEYRKEAQKKREEAARRRREGGFDWLFE